MSELYRDIRPSMKNLLLHKKLLWLWGLAPIVAILEIVIQFAINNSEPSTDEWREAASEIRSEKREKDLVVIAPEWVSPTARRFLGDLVDSRGFGRFDTDRYERIIQLSLRDARSLDTEGLELVSDTEFGPISVKTYLVKSKIRVIYDFLEGSSTSGQGGGKKVNTEFIVDHWFNPRLVIPLSVGANPSPIVFENVPLDGTLRGYGIIGYREARFNVGTPITLQVYVNDKLIGSREFRNFDPIEPFEFPINQEGTGTVKFQALTKDPHKRRFGFAADVRATLGAGK